MTKGSVLNMMPQAYLPSSSTTEFGSFPDYPHSGVKRWSCFCDKHLHWRQEVEEDQFKKGQFKPNKWTSRLIGVLHLKLNSQNIF